MTLNDLEGHLPVASHFECDFRTVLQLLTRVQLTARRAVSLQHLSFLSDRLHESTATIFYNIFSECRLKFDNVK